MRLFLLPVSSRRTLIYCDKKFVTAAQRNAAPSAGSAGDAAAPKTIMDRVTNRAAETWGSWEQLDGGWRKKLTTYGNALMRRIPFEEWGLKSIPPLSRRRKESGLAAGGPVAEVVFPPGFLAPQRVREVLERIATERQDLHRRRMIWSGLCAPLTLPFALVPIVPNIPGFYLLFRTWSHYRALYGAYHLEFLLKHNLVEPKPSPSLDRIYAAGLLASTTGKPVHADEVTSDQIQATVARTRRHLEAGRLDVMLLNPESCKDIAGAYALREIAMEVDRAYEQVDKALKAQSAQQAEQGDNEKQ